MGTLPMLLVMFGIFYFLLIRPQQKRFDLGGRLGGSGDGNRRHSRPFIVSRKSARANHHADPTDGDHRDDPAYGGASVEGNHRHSARDRDESPAVCRGVLKMKCLLLLLLLVSTSAHAQTLRPLCRSTLGKIDPCTAPTMSGANITNGTIPAGSLLGGTLNYFLASNGTSGIWVNTPVGWTISGASNTFANIPANTALTNAVAATNGGTGQSVYAVGDLLYASTTTALSKLSMGTAGHVLTSNGANMAPSLLAPVTSNTATGTAGATHDLTTNNYEAIPSLSVSLAAGTYLCSANVRSTVQCSAGTGYLTAKLYNVTAAADITSSERLGALCSTTGQAFTATTPIQELVTVGTTSTIQVYAVSPAGASYSVRQVLSDADGRSRLVCVKTAP